jgi:transitional endoplasmic reticulum ATPase
MSKQTLEVPEAHAESADPIAILIRALSGATTKKPTYKDVGVDWEAGRSSILLPEGMDENGAMEWLKRSRDQRETNVAINIDIDAYPLDGAVALATVLSNIYGWTNLVPTPGFFGPNPPSLLEVRTGPNTTQKVHWGRIVLPNIEGYLQTGARVDGNRLKFTLNGVVKRKHEEAARYVAEETRKEVRENSIYRGKAIKVSFREPNDDDLDEETRMQNMLNLQRCPEFIDVSKVRDKEVVFSSNIQSLIDVALFTPIEFTEECIKNQVPVKRGILVEGPYGTGKSLLSFITALKCVQNGWTYLYVADVRDLDKALEMAKQYQPCVVFGEDVDRAVGLDRDPDVDRILNTLDGVGSKDTKIMTVLTTNDVDNIHKAMIRPGRIDAVIPVRHPDSEAAVRLVKMFGRTLLEGTEDELAQALEPAIGSNAAVFREIVERAKMAAIRRIGPNSMETLKVTPSDIHTTAVLMQHHLQLLEEEDEEEDRPMAEFGEAVGNSIATAFENAKNEFSKNSNGAKAKVSV